MSVFVEGPEDLQQCRFSPQQLLWLVSRQAGRKVPMHTLRTWRQRIGVNADRDRCYGFEEVQYILEYLEFKDRGFSAEQYKAYKRGEFTPASI